MALKHRRYKLLLDENFPPRTYFPTCNNLHNVKHIKHDFNQAGTEDSKVYEFAETKKRLLVTFNEKDFRKLAARSSKTGIIAVSQTLPLDQIDKKLTALLRRKKPGALYRNFNSLTGEPLLT
jgi:predicted nuclease of predicted toxin-antitoxin system